MLSNDQLVILITSLGFSTGDPSDKPGADPIWPKLRMDNQRHMIRNFTYNVMIDMVEDGTPGFGGTRGPNVRSPFPAFGLLNNSIYQSAHKFYRLKNQDDRRTYATSVSKRLAKLHSQVDPDDINVDFIHVGNSRYYPLDYNLAESLRKDLSGSFHNLEFTSKVGGMVSIRFLGMGLQLPSVWESVRNFAHYLIDTQKEYAKADNASAPVSEPANAISKQVRNLIAKVPVDERYEAIHKFGDRFVKELELRGL